MTCPQDAKLESTSVKVPTPWQSRSDEEVDGPNVFPMLVTGLFRQERQQRHSTVTSWYIVLATREAGYQWSVYTRRDACSLMRLGDCITVAGRRGWDEGYVKNLLIPSWTVP